MPTILRFRGFNILICTFDHEPAHVHAIGHGAEIVFVLSCDEGPVEVRGRRNSTAAQESALIRFITDNRSYFVKHGRGCMADQKQYDILDVYADHNHARGLYIASAAYDSATRQLRVQLKNGVTISFPKERAQAIAQATDDQLSEIAITPAGWGILFPKLDEGISLAMLVAFRLGNDRWEEDWAKKTPEALAA